MKPNYDLLPEHIRPGVKRYVEQRVLPGDFLCAVIQNNLRDSFWFADDVNRDRMFDIVTFFFRETPAVCWGSPERMKAWLNHEDTGA